MSVVYNDRSAFDTWKFATPLRRLIAFAIDVVIVQSAIHMIFFLRHSFPSGAAQIHTFVTTMWCWDAFWLLTFDKTPGQHICKIYVYSPRNNGAPSPLQVTLRIIGFWMSVIPLGLGISPILFRRDRRSWHDLVSETIMIGPERSVPALEAQDRGRGVMFVQALVAFALLGAYLFSTTARLTNESTKGVEISACNNPHLLIDNTSDVMMALLISPAWSACWGQIDSALGPLQDTDIAEVAKLAKAYQDAFLTPLPMRGKFYESEIKSIEDSLCTEKRQFSMNCKTARDLASILSGTTDANNTPTTNWITLYRDHVVQLSKAMNAQERINILENVLAQNASQLVKSAVNERLWSERMAQGDVSKLPASSNIRWSEEQTCWQEALQSEGYQKCKTNNYVKLVKIAKNLTSNAHEAAKELQTQLEESDYDEEINALIDIYEIKKGIKSGNANDEALKITTLSPLQPFAQKLLN